MKKVLLLFLLSACGQSQLEREVDSLELVHLKQMYEIDSLLQEKEKLEIEVKLLREFNK